MSRCDSAAIVPNTSELLPEPDTPVNTVSRRLGISRLTSFRLFSRAPWTRITSWVSATCGAGDGVSGLVAIVIGRGSVLDQPEDVAVRITERGHETAAADVVGGLVGAGAGGRHLGQLRLDVGHVPVGDRRLHALRP